jgi:4'-phosphopantetheinyl transferase
LEHETILSVPPDEGLKRFFWIWTLKEAYTKALGLGLGFDFTRIQYDVLQNVVLIDGNAPKGWQFTKFEAVVGSDLYQGITAEFLGGTVTNVLIADGREWLVSSYDAAPFVQQAIHDLK